MRLYFKEFRDLSVEELYKILHARQEVFAIEQGIVYQDLDFIDQESWHAFILDENNDELVSYIRIIRPGVKYPSTSLGRLLTRKKFRHQGFGEKILRNAIRVAADNFGLPIIIDAQEYLVEFYKSIGFVPISQTFILEGIPHVEMILEKVPEGGREENR